VSAEEIFGRRSLAEVDGRVFDLVLFEPGDRLPAGRSGRLEVNGDSHGDLPVNIVKG
jgi:hypothetical protein